MAGAASKLVTVTIGDAARRVGLTPRAIRYYERIGLVETASRADSNYRLYDDARLRDLRFIARCRAIGLSLREIRSLRSNSADDAMQHGQADLLRAQLKLTEARIRALLSVRRDLRRQLAARPSDPNLGTAPDPSADVWHSTARHSSASG